MVKASDLQLFEISLSANVWNLLILKAVGSGACGVPWCCVYDDDSWSSYGPVWLQLS
jgi:hypothetical protein